jgi:2,4-dienoyl-CoA reductase-like NADH-dependent reductase (Old Yellow Enzyme family)
VPFSAASPLPREMTVAEIDGVVDAFVAAAQRSLAAGFDVAEVHMAHGYLLHEFLSPLANQRKDDYGGNLENRARLPLRVVKEVRAVWPQHLPLFVRISATDWVDKGWDLTQSLKLAEWLKKEGVDLIDCSTGGMTPDAVIPAGPGFQTPFAAAIKQQAEIAVGAVGLITAPEQAEQIIATGLADAVLLARELLRDPYWPLHAAQKLGAKISWPVQYERARPV